MHINEQEVFQLNIFKKIISGISALCMTFSIAAALPSYMPANAEDLSDSMEWGMLNIGGGGFISGIVTGKNVMYARTDVGGAYKYNFSTQRWEQLMSFITEQDKGYLSVDAVCVDPTDDNTVYMLCGCGYFSDARTAVFKTTDGGKTWTEHEVTDLIQVHGNGYGRQCGEAIAVDPDNPDIIYCGGDATAGESGLIMSCDGGETWEAVKGYGELGLFTYEINWPTWTTHKVKTTADAYDNSANGVGTIAIADGKVYVGTSVSGTVNMHVADVGSDDFKPLSSELPDNLFPSRINKDADGNLLICYVGGLAFNGASGGIYRYNIKTGEVTNISPSENGFGSCVSMGDNSDELIATTCGVWSLQRWDDTGENDEYGEWLYRSDDGGKTWDELNTDKHFGGTGNGNFIVGDMNEFGTVYMSTVGMGIVYGQFTGSSAEYENGDINGDGVINAVDALLLKRYILGEKLSSSQSKRADMNKNGSVDVIDEVILINKILK